MQVYDCTGRLAAVVVERNGDYHIRYRHGENLVECISFFTHAEYRLLERLLAQYPMPVGLTRWNEFLDALVRGPGAAADYLRRAGT
jgi:hypothetical protein